MKKLLSIIFVLAVMMATVVPAMAKGDRLEQIKEKGYIEFCTEPYWAPNEFIDPTKTGDDQYVGTDIELAKLIAEKIGVDLKINPLDFSAVLIGTADGKCDMAISAIAWSPTREMAMRLSNGYSFDETVGYGFLVREADVEKYTSIEDLANATVITQSGSVQEAIYNQYCGNAKNFKLVANMTDGYLAVAENKADVCITAIGSAELYAEANGGLAVPNFKFDTDPQMSATVVATPLDGTDSLMDVINEVIADVVENNKYQEWEDYYKEYAKGLGLGN